MKEKRSRGSQLLKRGGAEAHVDGVRGVGSTKEQSNKAKGDEKEEKKFLLFLKKCGSPTHREAIAPPATTAAAEMNRERERTSATFGRPPTSSRGFQRMHPTRDGG